MLKLSELKPKARKKSRKRLGRGTGSGTGTYAGRGLKGQKARTGGNIRPGFEGGRMPLIRQIPKKRGFRSPHPKAQAVNLDNLESAFQDGAEVTPKALLRVGLVSSHTLPIKILGRGKLVHKLNFKGVSFSASAKQAVEKAGGTIETEQAEQKEQKDVS